MLKNPLCDKSEVEETPRKRLKKKTTLPAAHSVLPDPSWTGLAVAVGVVGVAVALSQDDGLQTEEDTASIPTAIHCANTSAAYVEETAASPRASYRKAFHHLLQLKDYWQTPDYQSMRRIRVMEGRVTASKSMHATSEPSATPHRCLK